jgi:hypothetical protein
MARDQDPLLVSADNIPVGLAEPRPGGLAAGAQIMPSCTASIAQNLKLDELAARRPRVCVRDAATQDQAARPTVAPVAIR